MAAVWAPGVILGEVSMVNFSREFSEPRHQNRAISLSLSLSHSFYVFSAFYDRIHRGFDFIKEDVNSKFQTLHDDFSLLSLSHSLPLLQKLGFSVEEQSTTFRSARYSNVL